MKNAVAGLVNDAVPVFSNKFSEVTFPYLNYVSGFKGQKSYAYKITCEWGLPSWTPGYDERLCKKWNKPVDGEKR